MLIVTSRSSGNCDMLISLSGQVAVSSQNVVLGHLPNSLERHRHKMADMSAEKQWGGFESVKGEASALSLVYIY